MSLDDTPADERLEGTPQALQKVVVHCLDGRISKGVVSIPRPTTLSEALAVASADPTYSLTLMSEDGSSETIRLSEIKAFFVVASWEGDKDHQLVRFCTHRNDDLALWVEVRFRDGEIMEGLIYNSIHHLTAPGFLLTPSDPGSNNRVVYINKSAIERFRVLGLRHVSMN